MLTDRARQIYAQFRKDRKATLSYNESQVHKYDKFVALAQLLCFYTL